MIKHKQFFNYNIVENVHLAISESTTAKNKILQKDLNTAMHTIEEFNEEKFSQMLHNQNQKLKEKEMEVDKLNKKLKKKKNMINKLKHDQDGTGQDPNLFLGKNRMVIYQNFFIIFILNLAIYYFKVKSFIIKFLNI